MRSILLILAVAFFPVLPRVAAEDAAAAPLDLRRKIALAGVKGRIDHMAIDLKTKRLYIAALGNDSLEAVDLNKNEHVRSIGGFKEPQGVLYLPEPDKIVVSNG